MCFLHKYIRVILGLRNNFLRDTRTLVEEQLLHRRDQMKTGDETAKRG